MRSPKIEQNEEFLIKLQKKYHRAPMEVQFQGIHMINKTAKFQVNRLKLFEILRAPFSLILAQKCPAAANRDTPKKIFFSFFHIYTLFDDIKAKLGQNSQK